jgi:muramoyltetrapeptide carboxypeptidase
MTPLRHLRAGDSVAVIAPAGPCRDAEKLARLPALFEQHGLRAVLMPGCTAPNGPHEFLAASDEQRLNDVHAAWADDSIQALFALRGGYGCARFVDRIDTTLLRAHAKPLIGYSDITTLHALCSREGLPSFHAPMPASDWLQDNTQSGAQEDTDALFAVLMQPLPEGALLGRAPGDAWRVKGQAQGLLVGGNLSVIASLIGTPYALPVHGSIVFLEDVGEAPYRIDRLLTQLRLAGVLDAAAGFVLGSFTEADDATPVLQEHLRKIGKPLISAWPSGHGQPNRTLPLGARVQMDAQAGTLTLAQPVLV